MVTLSKNSRLAKSYDQYDYTTLKCLDRRRLNHLPVRRRHRRRLCPRKSAQAELVTPLPEASNPRRSDYSAPAPRDHQVSVSRDELLTKQIELEGIVDTAYIKELSMDALTDLKDNLELNLGQLEVYAKINEGDEGIEAVNDAIIASDNNIDTVDLMIDDKDYHDLIGRPLPEATSEDCAELAVLDLFNEIDGDPQRGPDHKPSKGDVKRAIMDATNWSEERYNEYAGVQTLLRNEDFANTRRLAVSESSSSAALVLVLIPFILVLGFMLSKVRSLLQASQKDPCPNNEVLEREYDRMNAMV